MHLVYSALDIPCRPTLHSQSGLPLAEIQIRREAYDQVCRKYQKEIADIRKYFPDWKPAFKH